MPRVLFRRTNISIKSAVVFESRAPVGSSARINAGFVTSARAMATRCCSPPESCVGRWRARLRSPTSASACRGRPPAVVRAAVDERQLHLGNGRPARQQVERLKHEADTTAANSCQLRLRHPVNVVSLKLVAATRRLVEAAQDVHERRLAGAGGPDDGQELAALNLQVDAAQGGHRNVAGAIHLGYALKPYHRSISPRKPTATRYPAASGRAAEAGHGRCAAGL